MIGIHGRNARPPLLVPGPVGAKGDVGATGATGPTGPPGGVAPIMVPDEFSASGSDNTFTASNIPITDSTIYVAYNQAILAKSHWSVGGGLDNVLTLDFTPEARASIVWSYYTSFVGPGTVLQEDFVMSSADATAGNAAGFFDFTLTHTPIANGIQIVALNGPLLKSTAWTFLAPTTFRVNAPPVAFAEDDTASIVYRY
jgi:hypothetical protein